MNDMRDASAADNRAQDIIARAKAAGISLRVQDGRLHFRAPKGVLNPELRAELSARQGEIIGLLQGDGSASRPCFLSEGEVVLSYGQRRWWLVERLVGGGGQGEYGGHIACVVELLGRLDVDRLRHALGELVGRHEPLRTVIRADADGQPRGELLAAPSPASNWPLPVEQVEAQRAGSRAHEEAKEVFDLERGPLLRTRLLRLGQERHHLVVSVHHIAADGWSLGVLVRELSQCYAGQSLEPLALRYSEFAQAQHESDASADLAYWRDCLAGLPELVLPEPEAPGAGVVSCARSLARPIAQGLNARAREGLTPFMLIQSGLLVLLARLSGQQDFALGTPVANRLRPEWEALVGFFVNTVVLRSALPQAGATVKELWQAVRAVTLDALAHQGLPFDRLVEVLQPVREGRRNPFFSVLFAVQNAPLPELDLSGLSVRGLPNPLVSTRLDLEIHAVPGADGSWSLAGTARGEVFSASGVQRLLAQLEHVLGRMLAAPEARWAELPVIDEVQAGQLARWSQVQPARCSSWLRAIVAQARAHPEALAYISEAGALSYAQLTERAARWASALRAAGVDAEVPVGVLLDRSSEHAVLALAVWWAGGVYVPLDVRLPAARLAQLIESTGMTVVLTRGLQPVVPAGVRVWDLAQQGLPEAALPCAQRSPEQGLYLLFTSGSTGVPKGVLVPDRTLDNLVAWQGRRSACVPTLQFAALSFDVSIQELLCTWAQGAPLVGVTHLERSDARALLEVIRRHGVGRLYLPVVMLHELAECALVQDQATPVREIITAGEALRMTPAVRAWAQRDGWILDNQYGPTETHVVSAWRLEGDAALWPERPWIGQALPNVSLQVRDAAGQPAPIGVPGELWIGGATLARGYYGEPGMSAGRFVAAPGAGRAYRSGDRVRWTEAGQLEYLGRADHQVKVRGHRVELGEVESQLRALAAVRQVVVVLHQGELAAYVEPHDGVERAALGTQLRQCLRERLPEYLVPAYWTVLQELPRNAHGKLERRALPPPQREPGGAETGAAPPRGPTENALAAIWAELLDLSVEQITREDDFFALGGHSLRATQLATRIARDLGVELPLATIFDQPVLARVAAAVDALDKDRGALPALQRADRSGPLPLSFAQERLWFINQFTPGEFAYNMPAALRLCGRLDVAALSQTFAQIVHRHEALRTAFGTLEGRAVQLIAARAPWSLQIEDLSALPAALREAETERLALQEAQRPFDLSRAPMLRTRLLKLAEEEHVLLVTLHHIAADGWSLGVLVREISALYAAFAQGLASPLPELEHQYADFALWQRNWLSGERLERELAYWRGQLENLPTLALPTDYARPARQSYLGALRTRTLPRSLSQAVEALAREHRATPFMVLLAAFQCLLGRLSGQDDVVVGTALANRIHPQLEPMIGFFVNSLVMRGDLRADPSFAQLLERVRSTALQAFAHQGLPFEKLVEHLQPERDASRHPLFQVAFAVQNAPMGELTLPNLTLQQFNTPVSSVRFDIEFHVWLHADGMRLVVCYATDLWQPETIDRLLRRFEATLEAATEEPHLQLSRLLRNTESEFGELRTLAKGTPHDASELDCVHRRFAAIAMSQPDATAVVCANVRMSYRELDAHANQIAHALRAAGIGIESRVAIHLERSCDLVAAILGVWKAGGAYVPLDPTQPKKRLDHMLADSQAVLRITTSRLAEELSGGTPVLAVDRLNLTMLPTSAPTDTAVPSHLAYLLYTSGSTGQPKGVLVEHRGVDNLQRAQIGALGVGPRDRALFFASVGFDASVSEICLGLMAGATLVIADAQAARSPELLAHLLASEQVSVATLTPSLLAVLPEEFPALRLLLTAGEPCPVVVARRWACNRRLVNAYGPTEATVAATMSRPIDPDDPRVPDIGRPIGGVEVFILDALGELAPLGMPGELYIGGAGVGRGYHNSAALTAERFIPDAWSGKPGARLYRSGDRVRWRADGCIEFIGRIDQQIKLRGQRIEPGEIEAALRHHPAIRDAAVALVDTLPQAVHREDAIHVSAPIGPIELWPSIAEHFVYDETLYHAMTHDEARNAYYRSAFEAAVPGKIVVDIGTGADAILARMCIESGARHVYAIERLETSWRSACATVQRLGLNDRITLVHGDATEVVLPESADLCVSEIVGPIGGAEGSAVILNDAWRFLKPGARMIPARTLSVMAAVELPAAFLRDPAFTPLTAGYVRRIFEDTGVPFDLRLCVKGVSSTNLMSDIAVFEDLDHSGLVPTENEHDIVLTVNRDAHCAGFLVWLRLYVDPAHCLDTLDVTCCWLPVYLPAIGDGLMLRAGTAIRMRIKRRLAANGLNPDFLIEGRIELPGEQARSFSFNSWHSPISHAGEAIFRGAPFYRRLFREVDGAAPPQRLLAWVATRFGEPQAAATEAAMQQDRVKEWRELYENTINTSASESDLALAGWNSSYTGDPIDPAEMRVWRDATVARIRALKPRRVWEIGCGNGLLLWPLAQECAAYRGTDFSQAAVAAVSRRIAESALPHVTVDVAEAAAALEGRQSGEQYDTIIMNSVVQYFPGLAYLERVLNAVACALAKGGAAFVGDVRGRQWLPALHASVVKQRYRSATRDEQVQRVRASLAAEEELTVDPAWFHSLRLPGLSHVAIWLKDEATENELTWFRYDVTLYFGSAPPSVQVGATRPLAEFGGDLASLAQWLAQSQCEAVVCTGVPNTRVLPHIAAAASFNLVAKPDPAPGFKMKHLQDLAHTQGYFVRFAPTMDGRPGYCDALFERHSTARLGAWRRQTLAPGGPLANNPLRRRQENRLRDELPTFLRQWIPDAMLPADFVLLDALPLSASGKVDRKGLPEPSAAAGRRDATFATDRIELDLIHLWEELLGVAPIGVNDNFFALGGHSLLAVQLMARVRTRFGQTVPLSVLLEQPTIVTLARHLRAEGVNSAYSPLVMLRAGGPLDAIFCVHPGGGGALCYQALAQRMPPDRAVWGLQALGLEAGETPLESVEAMAELYVSALRERQSKGPYHLIGWSFGGHIAHEMACQLERAGCAVGLVAVLDAMPPEHVPRVDERYLLQHAYLAYLAQQAGLDVTEAELVTLEEDAQIKLVAGRAIAQGVLPPGSDAELIRRLLKLTAISGRLAREYRPRRFHGVLHFLRAAEALTPELAELAALRPACGWDDYADVRVHVVQGSHKTMLMPPHLDFVADCLRRLLSQ